MLNLPSFLDRVLLIGLLACLLICHPMYAAGSKIRQIPAEHPRLLGSAGQLKQLAAERPEAYARVVDVARNRDARGHAKMVSLSLVYAIEGDAALGDLAVSMAMKYINGPIRVGHVRFGDDLANTAIVYDLCYPRWTAEQRLQYHEYMNKTVDANVRSETSVFHNGWYSYKHWGIGLAAYATYYENERAPGILDALEEEYRTRVVPAFALAGNGGGWAEGYYINYWSYEWMFFCEVARRCEGADYFGMSPEFLGNRAVACMFEAYPGIREFGSRRPIPIGDSGGRIFGSDRDKSLSARRILVNRFREDSAHKVVHTFNEATPVIGASTQPYKDFLWRDTTVAKGDLDNFKLSHLSPGPGFVYARSSWKPEATYFFFKCGDRFTSHQHLDVGNFLIYKYEELVGDGGQYVGFGTEHDVNYHLRTIAHNTILVYDPEETWPNIRAWKEEIGNDGGQHHNWPHHNGNVLDAAQWQRRSYIYDIAEITTFEDRGSYIYVAGDCSRAYSAKKLEYFTRQIVFIRPGTFVIFDRVKARKAAFRKTWLLQAMKTPEGTAPNMTITNGEGKLFVQTVLPADPEVKLCSGDDLYTYGGRSYPPETTKGAAPACRVEISPKAPSTVDYFLHVLTACDAETSSVPEATAESSHTQVRVSLGATKLVFNKAGPGGQIEINGHQARFADSIVQE